MRPNGKAPMSQCRRPKGYLRHELPLAGCHLADIHERRTGPAGAEPKEDASSYKYGVPSLCTKRPSAFALIMSTSEQVVTSSICRDPTSRYIASRSERLIM